MSYSTRKLHQLLNEALEFHRDYLDTGDLFFLAMAKLYVKKARAWRVQFL